MTGVVHAAPLGPRVIPIRVLDTTADAPGVAAFVKAGEVIRTAERHADLRAATDLVGRSAMEMGLDRFQPFLREADQHLDRTGGMVALIRDVQVPAVPPAVRAIPRMVPPRLMPRGPVGPLLRGALRGALFGIAIEMLEAYSEQDQEQQNRDAIERFKLDPTNPADAAAALAYRYAQFHGPWLFDTPPTGPLMQAMAERVMRGVQADPTLLNRALEGDRAAIADLTEIAQGKVVPGSGIETRTDEERALVAQMMGERSGGTEIQAALDHMRATGRPPTAEERRNLPGEAVVSDPLPHVDGFWLADGMKNDSGARVPEQIAEKLEGRSFPTFKAFREAFWKAVAATPELAAEFSPQNTARMRNGNAPFAPKAEGTSRGRVWELHHDPEIGRGGPVYDLSTMTVVTPRQHGQLHLGD